MQLVKGIMFVAVIYLIVNLFGMEASTNIFRMIFNNIILIIFVLFAPEIRKILEQVGKGTARKNFKTIIHPGVAVELTEIQNAIESTIKACSNLSDSKTGALIVFENDTLLGNVIDSGTLMNAKASRELIENIFYPKTPLHDGAMVIRNGEKTNNGFLITFAPYDQPEISIASEIDYAGSGTSTAEITSSIIEYYYSNNTDEQPAQNTGVLLN